MDARELHVHAREGSVPPEFAREVEALARAEGRAIAAREHVHDMIREAHALGVGPSKLARWTGYSPRRIGQIVADDS